MTALASGANVGKYVLLRELGKGAMATVFEARHVELGKRAALKTMHPHLAADRTASSRFLREGKAAAQIHSAHVVNIFDVGTQDGVPYLVMDLLDGVDLGALLRERGKLEAREIADLMLPICSAVQAAHAVGVIHRDLKPSNIMLVKSDSGELAPTVLDFGISKIERDAGDDLTASEVLLGTVHYMSPEQTRGARAAGPLSDVYSLGVILYECATGAKPFAGTTPYALMHAIVSTKVTPPSALNPALSHAFDEVVLRAMHRDPSKRFPSARALGSALVPWAGDEARRQWSREFGDEPTRAPARRQWRAWTVVAVVAAGIAFAFSNPKKTAAPTATNVAAASSTPPTIARTASVSPRTTPIESSIPHAPASIQETAPSTPQLVHLPHRSTRSSTLDAAAEPERGTNGAPIVE